MRVIKYVRIDKGYPIEIRALAHWNLIGYNTTAPPPVSSRNSILPPPSSNSAFGPAEKNSVRV
jgi:hypothetical protein